MGILKEIIDSDMSLPGVLLAVLLFWFLRGAFDRWREVGETKKISESLTTGLNELNKSLSLFGDNLKDIKTNLDEFKVEQKTNFVELALKIEKAFDDLHKLRNIIMVEQQNTAINQKTLARLEADVKSLQERVITLKAVEDYKQAKSH